MSWLRSKHLTSVIVHAVCFFSLHFFFYTLAVSVCFRRNGAHSATAATARLPDGSSHAAQHAGHDGNELWGTNGPRCHPHAGQPHLLYVLQDKFRP